MEKHNGIAFIATCFFTIVTASDLTLVGNSSANWNTTESIWTNSSGRAVTFTSGDNVLISSDSFTGPSLMMTDRLSPGNVVFDVDNVLVFGWSGTSSQRGLTAAVKSFVKRGHGTLRLVGNGAASQYEGISMTCGVDIEEGEIACATANVHNFLGWKGASYWVHVRDGASLSFLERNQTGTFDDAKCGICINLDKGASLNICTNSPGTFRPLAVNTLKLSGGSVTVGNNCYYGSNDNKIGGNASLYVFNKIHFAGDERQSLGCGKDFASDGRHLISLNPRTPVEICVDDVEEGVDAEICMKGFTWGTNSVGLFKCDIVKTGAGTLLIPSNDVNRVFLGDFTIQNGTVEFASSSSAQNFFKDTSGNQTITISTNATLRVRKRNLTVGEMSEGNTSTAKIIVDHGTLEFLTDNSTKGCLQAKDWVFDDATLLVSNKGHSSNIGIFYFRNSVTFRGTHALMMMPDETLSADEQAVNVHITNGTRTIFDVADMTGDAATDVTIGYHIWNGVTADNVANALTDSGFVKVGPGTLSVASMTNKVSGEVTVSNGVLRVDGRLVTPSSVKIAATAYLGGTGTVANVVLESGAGLAADAGERMPLNVNGNLALPATGSVYITGFSGAGLPRYGRTAIVAASGTLSGTDNLKNWTVKADGVNVANWVVYAKAGTVWAKPGGFVISFK